MNNPIFAEGWWTTLFLYAAIYFLTTYAVYNIIFAGLVGKPQSWSYRDIRFWKRKATFFNAVIFAPLYEEFLFTYLAYASFLQYAQTGREWLVVLLVASFFAILHLPGDLRRQQNSWRGIRPLYLLLGQLNRFFFSLAAYFLFLKTGSLWASIVLHYLVNGIISVYHFDLEDGHRSAGVVDILEIAIILLEIVLVIFASYNYHLHFPNQGIYLLGIGLFLVVRWSVLLLGVSRARA